MICGTRRGCLEPAKVLLQVGNIVDAFRNFEVVGNRLKVDAMLRKEGFIFLEAVDEVPLMRLLLAAPRRLGRDNAALDAGLDAVGTRFLLVATDLALLTKDA